MAVVVKDLIKNLSSIKADVKARMIRLLVARSNLMHTVRYLLWFVESKSYCSPLEKVSYKST
jgi:hypothetical protein